MSSLSPLSPQFAQIFSHLIFPMFTQFRVRYPQGSLITELLAINHGQYIVRCWISVEGITLATGLAAAATVELAEDQARSRALAVLGMDSTTAINHPEVKSAPEAGLDQPALSIPPSFSSEMVEPSPPEQLPSRSPAHNHVNSMSLSDVRDEQAQEYISNQVMTVEEMPAIADFNPTEMVSAIADGETGVRVAQKPAQSKRGTSRSGPSNQQVLDAEAQPDTYSNSEQELNDQPLPLSSVTPLHTDTEISTKSETPIDFSDIIARTNVELRRLGWTNQQGRDYLVQTYGKRSRQLLTDDELIDFLNHLESEPTPE